MSTGVEQLSDSLRNKLSEMEAQLAAIKSDVKAGDKKDMAAVQAKLKVARANIHIMAKDVKTAEVKAQAWVITKEKAGEAVIQGWKAKLEKTKLEHHAKSAEENAVAAIALAEAKIGDAAFATYEAMDARMTADATPAAKHEPMGKNHTSEPKKPRRLPTKNSKTRASQEKLDHDEHYDLDGVTQKRGNFTTLDQEWASSREHAASSKKNETPALAYPSSAPIPEVCRGAAH